MWKRESDTKEEKQNRVSTPTTREGREGEGGRTSLPSKKERHFLFICLFGLHVSFFFFFFFFFFFVLVLLPAFLVLRASFYLCPLPSDFRLLLFFSLLLFSSYVCACRVAAGDESNELLLLLLLLLQGEVTFFGWFLTLTRHKGTTHKKAGTGNRKLESLSSLSLPPSSPLKGRKLESLSSLSIPPSHTKRRGQETENSNPSFPPSSPTPLLDPDGLARLALLRLGHMDLEGGEGGREGRRNY